MSDDAQPPAPELLTVPPEDAGRRADVWLAAASGRSRSRVQALILDGRVHVRDGTGAEYRPHASLRVVPGMEFSVEEPPPAPVDVAPQDIPLAILYEDDAILVLDKQAGLVVHPAPGHEDGTLVNALLHHCEGKLPVINGEERPGIVHRLDRFTSGLLVVGKTADALRGLAAQFQEGKVHKIYAALVHGIPRPASGHIETLIGRKSSDRKKMAVVESGGRMAITDYETRNLFTAANGALLDVRIATGRTHQIRVHMRHIGHPVMGDPDYGSGRLDNALGIPRGRQFLHARSLSFLHPVTGEPLAFESPLPEDFEAALRIVRETAHF